jgi:hypothetical protein
MLGLAAHVQKHQKTRLADSIDLEARGKGSIPLDSLASSLQAVGRACHFGLQAYTKFDAADLSCVGLNCVRSANALRK